MQIQLNGRPYSVPDRVRTVGELLSELGVQDSIVMVEQNGKILEREEHPASPLEENDQVEIVRFVGGG
ncbi:sulfur carrier protein ThiS [Salinithrix halophila]|uniref:Sulfur carrier protein ThiS n=1 Tax=Salinithrix halophila TaxID=1485204 RepID=A0ABV8JD59_9BACL